MLMFQGKELLVSVRRCSRQECSLLFKPEVERPGDVANLQVPSGTYIIVSVLVNKL